MHSEWWNTKRKRDKTAPQRMTLNGSGTSKRSPIRMDSAVENLRRLQFDIATIAESGHVRRLADPFARAICLAALALIGVGMSVLPSEAASRTPIACGVVYSIERGDTLFKIAERAFGDGKLYEQLFNANRDVLPSSASVEIGNQIMIPCLDGAGHSVRQESVAMQQIPEAAKYDVAAIAAIEELNGEIPQLPEAPVRSSSCGTLYTIARGDTLFNIAKRSFGDGWKYKKIFEANQKALPNSASVEVGIQILIPCLDEAGQIIQQNSGVPKFAIEVVPAERVELQVRRGSEPFVVTTEPIRPKYMSLSHAADLVAMAALTVLPIAESVDPMALQTTAIAVPIGTSEIEKPGMPIKDLPIRLVTAKGAAPVADEDAIRGGLVTDLLLRAVDVASPGTEAQVAFVNEWPSQVDQLLAGGANDVSFPWAKPDCSNTELLDAVGQRRCSDFEFSKPIFEVRIGFYARSGDNVAAAEAIPALSGKRLCSPAGQFTFDAVKNLLAESSVSLESEYTATQCFIRLVKGQVDIVAVSKPEADIQLRHRVFAEAAVEISGLETSQTLHAMVSRQNPDSVAVLEVINRGLSELMISGKWFEIVATHQSEQLAALY